MIEGVNPAAFFILPMLGKHADDYPRFRDCFVQKRKFKLNKDGLPLMSIDEDSPKWFDNEFKSDPEPVICVFTRMGGGNSECWEDGEPDCDCPACEADKLENHECFVERFDDDFDCTYCTFVFKVPEKWLDDYQKILDGNLTEISDEYKSELYRVYPKLKDKFDIIFSEESDDE